MPWSRIYWEPVFHMIFKHLLQNPNMRTDQTGVIVWYPYKYLLPWARLSGLAYYTACVQLVALIQTMGVPSTYGFFPPHNFFKTPIEIAVSVETLIQIEDNQLFHSHAFHSPTSKVVLPQSEPKASLPPCMSLPRANYDPRRVCLNPFPEVSLGRHKRTIGIYLAGALVSPLTLSHRGAPRSHPNIPVRLGKLDVFRCRHPLRPRTLSLG